MANPNYDGQVKQDIDGSSNPAPPPYQPNPPNPNNAQYGATGHPPQQPGMPTQTVIFTTQTPFLLRADPCVVQCPTCNQQVVTMVEYENGSLTWISVGILCVFGCWLGCCLFPTCINELKDVLHICPNCKNFLGRYRRMH